VADALFQVEIVSPARPLFRGEAGSLVAAGHDGEIGILPGHAPLMSLLGTGIVRVATAGLHAGSESFAIRGGFLQILGRKVTLLVTQAIKAADVDAAKAKAGLEKALAELQHPKTDADYERLLDERRWWEAQLKLAGAA
jgi:F-type H+-transporting ATPase subunit epsilon